MHFDLDGVGKGRVTFHADDFEFVGIFFADLDGFVRIGVGVADEFARILGGDYFGVDACPFALAGLFPEVKAQDLHFGAGVPIEQDGVFLGEFEIKIREPERFLPCDGGVCGLCRGSQRSGSGGVGKDEHQSGEHEQGDEAGERLCESGVVVQGKGKHGAAPIVLQTSHTLPRCFPRDTDPHVVASLAKKSVVNLRRVGLDLCKECSAVVSLMLILYREWVCVSMGNW